MNKGFQLLTDHIEITQGGTSTPREKPLPLGVRKKRGKTKGTVVPPKKCVQYWIVINFNWWPQHLEACLSGIIQKGYDRRRQHLSRVLMSWRNFQTSSLLWPRGSRNCCRSPERDSSGGCFGRARFGSWGRVQSKRRPYPLPGTVDGTAGISLHCTRINDQRMCFNISGLKSWAVVAVSLKYPRQK